MKLPLEELVLAHRYLYYVKMKPVISDRDYDDLEARAIARLPEGSNSPILEPGSDLESSYSKEIKEYALSFLKDHKMMDRVR